MGQFGSPRKTGAECAEQIDPDCTRLVDQLQQRPAIIGIRMNVVLEECAGKRLGN